MSEIAKIIEVTLLKNEKGVCVIGSAKTLTNDIMTALSGKVVPREELENLLGLLQWTAGGERALNSIKKYMNKHNMEKMTSEKFQDLEIDIAS